VGRREETAESEGWNAGTGDVKYHQARKACTTRRAARTWPSRSRPNPSHLESVNPVVEARARANQTNRRGAVAETRRQFRASGVAAAGTPLLRPGGRRRDVQPGAAARLHDRRHDPPDSQHQIGFTTDPREGRSTDFYSSDLAKGFDAPRSSTSMRTTPKHAWRRWRLAMMLSREIPCRRRDRFGRLPPLWPQRSGRACVHAAGDVRAHQADASVREKYAAQM